MRVFFCLLILFISGLYPAQAQVKWIANAKLPGAPFTSLYDMVSDGKPVVIAVGNMHTPASEALLNSGMLQKLASEHGALHGDKFSSQDLRVAFIDIQVMPDESAAPDNSFIFVHLNESDETLNRKGWSDLYSISNTHLFLVTPDRLVRPLKGTTADEVYTEAKFWMDKIRPKSTPDIRLLDAVAGTGKTAAVRVQNFSTSIARGVSIVVSKNGQEIARTNYIGTIAPLEDAEIPVSLPEGSAADLTIIAKVDGDTNELNNRWVGAPRHTADASMIAGTFAK